MSDHRTSPWSLECLWPPGSREGQWESSCHPPWSDRGSGPTGPKALPEEAAPSVNFLEAQFAHHWSRSGRRIIRRGCSVPRGSGLAGPVREDPHGARRQTPPGTRAGDLLGMRSLEPPPLPISLLRAGSNSGLGRRPQLLLSGVLPKAGSSAGAGFVSETPLGRGGRQSKGRSPTPWPSTSKSTLRGHWGRN